MTRRCVPSFALMAAFALACQRDDRAGTSVSPQAQASPPAHVATPDDPAREQQAKAKARDAALTLGRTLKQKLFEAMAHGGPAAAISVCANEARAITEGVARETGALVGRSSLRLRNPQSAGPAWVRARLEQLGERPAQGVEPLSEIGSAGGKHVARFAAPIAVEGPCLTCHGPREAIPPEVRAVLDERYPSDRAYGYADGDLRGLIWAELAFD